MTTALLQRIDPFIVLLFRVHDVLSAFLARHLFAVKRGLLIVAHLSLFGFFFPELRRDFGETAAHVLLVILFLSPLSKIFRTRLLLQMMSLRRELGILMAYLATVHGLGYLIVDPKFFETFFAPYLFGNVLGIEPAFLLGAAAYALTLPLLLTSNNLATKYLGSNWKRLHRIVYAVFAFAVLHRMLIKGADASAIIQSVILVSSYVLAKIVAWKNFLPFLREGIAYVGERYRNYTQAKAVIQQSNV